MAVITTLGDVESRARTFRAGVERLEAALDVFLAVHDERGDNLHGSADGDGDEDEQGERADVLDDALMPVRPFFLGGLERRGRL